MEDQAADAELMVEALQDSGFDVSWQLVSTEDGYRDALNSGIDVILCDHALPSFDAGRAFELLQQARLPIPMLIVSGLITEELAIEYMQRGAYDFVGKDRLGHLGASVRNALERGALEREVHTSAVRIDALLHELDGRAAPVSKTGPGATRPPEADPINDPAVFLQDSTHTVDVAGNATPSHGAWFDALPDAYLIMAPDTTIVAVSDGYVLALMRSRQELVGRKTLDVFPRSRPDALKPHYLSASIARTLGGAVPDAMPIQKYAVVRAKHQGGGLVERYWSVLHSALLGQDGNVAWVMQRIEDVTELVELRQIGDEQGARSQRLQTRATHLEAEIHEQSLKLQVANGELRELSLRDPLTALYNRRGLSFFLEKQIAGSNRADQPFHVLLIDVDRLKVINDSLGHAYGDDALVDTAQILTSTLREGDVVARIGGDEFAVLSHEEGDNPIVMCRRLSRSLAKHNRTADRPFSLALSIGSIRYKPGSMVTPEQLLAGADRSMYEAKRKTLVAAVGTRSAPPAAAVGS